MSITPRFASIADWVAISGMGRSVTYELLGRGILKARKLGTKTLVDVEHGLAYIASLPPAQITAGTRPVHRLRDQPPPLAAQGGGK